MQASQPSSPDQQPLPVQLAANTDTANPNKRRRLALWLMLGPTALLIVTIFAYTVINLLTGAAAPDPDSVAAINEPNLVSRITNIALFVIGGIVVITWLPGLIAGILLLTKKKS